MQLGFSNSVLLKHQKQNILLEPKDVGGEIVAPMLRAKDHAHE